MNLSIHKLSTTKKQKYFINALLLVIGIEFGLYISNPVQLINTQKRARNLVLSLLSDTPANNSQTSEKLQNSPFAADLEPIFAAPVSMYIRKSSTLSAQSDQFNPSNQSAHSDQSAKSDRSSQSSGEKIIDLDLINIGVEPDGKLETPKDWFVGGWYVKSAHPGEKGNLIINAHYDTDTGAPAAFYNLKNVKINDKVFVVDDLGRTFVYTVTDLIEVDIQDPNRLKVFDSNKDKSELTLITCNGVWIPEKGYSKRLVVKAGR